MECTYITCIFPEVLINAYTYVAQTSIKTTEHYDSSIPESYLIISPVNCCPHPTQLL